MIVFPGDVEQAVSGQHGLRHGHADDLAGDRADDDKFLIGQRVDDLAECVTLFNDVTQADAWEKESALSTFRTYPFRFFEYPGRRRLRSAGRNHLQMDHDVPDAGDAMCDLFLLETQRFTGFVDDRRNTGLGASRRRLPSGPLPPMTMPNPKCVASFRIAGSSRSARICGRLLRLFEAVCRSMSASQCSTSSLNMACEISEATLPPLVPGNARFRSRRSDM